MVGPLTSWGRYPHHPQQSVLLHWRDELQPALTEIAHAGTTSLGYGNGRSYGDSCLAVSDCVLHMRALNRFISANWQTGVVRAEAGLTLEELLEVAIPRGWFLPVTPGTKYATLGGAVANDVHGKNHHVRGTFGNHVERFALLRSDSGCIECSATDNDELFRATIGGLGLTGIIAWVELHLMPIRSSEIDVLSTKFGNLDEFFSLSDELDHQHEYSVAWIDCLASGTALGRGRFFAGNHAHSGALEVASKRRFTVPVTAPFSLINPVTLRALNTAYYHRQQAKRVVSRADYDSYFYPLDSLLEWNRLYGKRGFQQYQCVVPQTTSHDAIDAILREIALSGTGSFLAVLKRCGDKTSPGLLSFPMPGTSLALDFPETGTRNAQLFARLDAIVHQSGGRLYPAKDAHMSGADFRCAYPQWEKLEVLRDRTLLSRFWQRVTQP